MGVIARHKILSFKFEFSINIYDENVTFYYRKKFKLKKFTKALTQKVKIPIRINHD
jgi:hypothetical protein